MFSCVYSTACSATIEDTVRLHTVGRQGQRADETRGIHATSHKFLLPVIAICAVHVELYKRGTPGKLKTVPAAGV